MSSKTEKLNKLDGLVLDKMIEIMSDKEGDMRDLGDMNVIVQYLAKNSVVAEKEKSTVEEDVKKRVKAAEKRREEKDSK